MSILEIQQALKAAGHDPGPLDGKMGPKTRAAITAYQQANGLTVDGIAGPQTQGRLKGGGPTAPSAVGTDKWSEYRAKYPQFAWAFNDPEVAAELQYAIDNKLGPDELQGRIQATNWWKSKTNAERDWLQTLSTNPAEATRQLNNYDSITKYIATASAYGMNVSFEAAARQVDRVVRGEIAPDALQQELRNMAKGLLPHLAQQIDSGQLVEDIFEPIRGMASRLLGTNPADIKLSDARWLSLLQTDDGKGGFRLPSMAEIEKRLKTDPSYGFVSSQGGRDSAFGAINAISRGFGFGEIA